MPDAPSTVQTERFRSAVERLREGDEGAFRELYEALSDKVFSFLVPRSSSRDDALDLLQEVFVDVWAARLRFAYKNDASVYGFVFTIARRTLARHYERNRKDAAIEELPFDERYDMDVEALGDIHTVERALGELNESDRDVVTLRYWSGLSFAEIADATGSNENAVRVKHHRALEKLQKIMEHET